MGGSKIGSVAQMCVETSFCAANCHSACLPESGYSKFPAFLSPNRFDAHNRAIMGTFRILVHHFISSLQVMMNNLDINMSRLFQRAPSGMNLTFGTHLQLHSFSNVKFNNSTRFNNLLVVLLIPTFANMGAATGCKCWYRTTSSLKTNKWNYQFPVTVSYTSRCWRQIAGERQTYVKINPNRRNSNEI